MAQGFWFCRRFPCIRRRWSWCSRVYTQSVSCLRSVHWMCTFAIDMADRILQRAGVHVGVSVCACAEEVVSWMIQMQWDECNKTETHQCQPFRTYTLHNVKCVRKIKSLQWWNAHNTHSHMLRKTIHKIVVTKFNKWTFYEINTCMCVWESCGRSKRHT